MRRASNAFVDCAHRSALAAAAVCMFLSISAAQTKSALPPAFVERAIVDSQTTLLEIVDDDVEMTRFISFRAPAEKNLSSRLVFIQPVEGPPRNIKAQVMTPSAFERAFLCTRKTEQAFYAQAASVLRVQRCLFFEIGANGGAPAWFVLWKKWSFAVPAITALKPLDTPSSPRDLHAVADLQVLPCNSIDSLPPSLAQQARSAIARLKDPYLIVISMAPALSYEGDADREAMAGLRLSCTLALAAGEKDRLKVPPLIGDFRGKVPLARTYIAAPAEIAVRFDATASSSSMSPQRLVNEAVTFLGARSGKGLASKLIVTSTRLSDNTLIQRHVATMADSAPWIDLPWHRSGMGVLGTGRRAIGEILMMGLWPVACFLFMGGIGWSKKVYLWMMGVPDKVDSGRKLAIHALLFPILTPWLVLRWSRPELSEADDEGDDALSVLPSVEYDALSRLVVWGLLVAVNWALLESYAAFALWLRFG